MALKSLSLLIIFIFLFVTAVSATDCQYKDNRSYLVDEEMYLHNDNFFAKNINLDELITFELIYQPWVIRVTNNLSVPITVNVTYHRHNPWFGFDDWPTTQVTVQPSDYELIKDSHISGIKGYVFSEPNVITHFTSGSRRVEEICEICPNGKPCLDDGKSCSLSSQCGSGVCNINSVCGVSGSSFVVSCLDGKRNCKNKFCLEPSVKAVGDAFKCEWECMSDVGEDGICKKSLKAPCTIDSECGSAVCNIAGFCGEEKVIECSDWIDGTMNCDNQCLKPSTKEYGEGYSCEWECISDRGVSDKCAWSISELVKRWTLFFIICFVVIAITKLYLLNTLLKRLKINVGNQKKELAEGEKNIKEIEQKINDLNENYEKGQNKIARLKEKIKEVDGEAKRILEERLRKEEQEQQERRHLIKINNQELDGAEDRQRDRRRQLEEDIEELEEKSYEKYQKDQWSKYKKMFNSGSKRVKLKGNYFIISYPRGKPEYLHRYVYRHSFNLSKGDISGLQVHHIDNNPLNNEIWNLIAIPKELHDTRFRGSFPHSKVWKNDWLLGFKELQNYLNWPDEKYHKYIWKHYKKLKE